MLYAGAILLENAYRPRLVELERNYVIGLELPRKSLGNDRRRTAESTERGRSILVRYDLRAALIADEFYARLVLFTDLDRSVVRFLKNAEIK